MFIQCGPKLFHKRWLTLWKNWYSLSFSQKIWKWNAIKLKSTGFYGDLTCATAPIIVSSSPFLSFPLLRLTLFTWGFRWVSDPLSIIGGTNDLKLMNIYDSHLRVYISLYEITIVVSMKIIFSQTSVLTAWHATVVFLCQFSKHSLNTLHLYIRWFP